MFYMSIISTLADKGHRGENDNLIITNTVGLHQAVKIKKISSIA